MILKEAMLIQGAEEDSNESQFNGLKDIRDNILFTKA